MKTIIVATDFSPASFNASAYAADMANAIKADLLLFHVYNAPVIYAEIPVVVNPPEPPEESVKKMNELKRRLSSRISSEVIIQAEIMKGDFYHELDKLCGRIMPYAVVMGSQGSTGAKRFFLGSNAVYTAKHLPWPVITVPPDVSFTSIKKIGLACDFENVVDTIPVDEINRLVKDFQASLHILNTGKGKEFKPEMIQESAFLQEMILTLEPTYHFIRHENTDEGIMDFAEENHIDLLLVIPKRHGMINSLLNRSHSKQLVLHSHIPVMAIH